jgi:mannose-1-phosphate guanylyltransferase / phosphomannomutase
MGVNVLASELNSTSALILAGGFGTRMRSAFGTLPKPLVPLAGRPILFRIIDDLLIQGINDICVTVHYMSDMIIERTQQEFGSKIKFSKEETPLGTGGSVLLALPFLQETFLVINGDMLIAFNYKSLLKFHLENNFQATLTLHHGDNPNDADLVSISETFLVENMYFRPRSSEPLPPTFVNAGISILNKRCLDSKRVEQLNFERDIVSGIILKQNNLKVGGYFTNELIKDLGTPERLLEAARLLEAEKLLKSETLVSRSINGLK